MNFGEALAAMEDGKKVRRAEWANHHGPGSYRAVWIEQPPGFMPHFTARLAFGDKVVMVMNPAQIFAKDWEVIDG